MAAMAAAALAMAGAALSAWGFGDARIRSRRARLAQALGLPPAAPPPADDGDELDRPFAERWIAPAAAAIRAALVRLWPPQMLEGWRARLAEAGSSRSPGAWLTLRALGAIAAGAAGAGLAIRLPALPQMRWAPLLLGGAAWWWPAAHLRTAADARRSALRRQLADVFDLLSLQVEAGRSFDQALRAALPLLPEPARGAFGGVLQDLRVGATRAEALRALAGRTGVPELGQFAALVIQAERTGLGMAPLLREQAARAREQRLWLARERAATAPIRILFPLVVFLFPALFVVLIGPGAIRIVQSGAFGLF